jgi:hypothetical protein
MLINATALDRKSGKAQWSDLRSSQTSHSHLCPSESLTLRNVTTLPCHQTERSAVEGSAVAAE